MAWGGAKEQEEERAAGNPNAKNWHDEALKILEQTAKDYWELSRGSDPLHNADGDTQGDATDTPPEAETLGSAFDRRRRELEANRRMNGYSLGWQEELRRYLTCIADNVSKDMNVIEWWAKHSNIYPTFALIARDVCAIPVTSVPCERLFSAGAGIATDQRSRLGSDRFEELQVMKHTWRKSILDRAAENSSQVEEVWLDDFKELHRIDEDLTKDDEILAGPLVETVEL
ncbi:hypothetical protein SCLCIDRAFT_142179 [Scleroderma citrinum Foug A]|uniref:HAT C-terminal dimerisation domain-containing protein n=1 Tax=Scleroderma citrinum Foug A TaxID=1036808 RepID=A0A0C2YQE5_9AGAM|nr:hypothetical protein SCLCIDRAFT_142179 [Scleroderma citrinum Foug A]